VNEIKFWFLAINIIMTVAGSTLLKLGSRSVNFEGSVGTIILGFVTSPVIIAGFAVYAIAAVLWVYCLSQFELSYVTFVTSLQYILLLTVSIAVFHEQISVMKWAGCFFIMVGVICWMKG
jgi:drug/metabolite transporter (DMT)-like permease